MEYGYLCFSLYLSAVVVISNVLINLQYLPSQTFNSNKKMFPGMMNLALLQLILWLLLKSSLGFYGNVIKLRKSGQGIWNQSSALFYFKMLNRCKWDTFKMVIRQNLLWGRWNQHVCLFSQIQRSRLPKEMWVGSKWTKQQDWIKHSDLRLSLLIVISIWKKSMINLFFLLWVEKEESDLIKKDINSKHLPNQILTVFRTSKL